MLAADDIASRYVVLIDEDATIDALFLGGIDRAEVSGSIASLIVVGKADAELRSESSVQSVIMGDSRADVHVDAGALVSEVYAPMQSRSSSNPSPAPFAPSTPITHRRRTRPSCRC